MSEMEEHLLEAEPWPSRELALPLGRPAFAVEGAKKRCGTRQISAGEDQEQEHYDHFEGEGISQERVRLPSAHLPTFGLKWMKESLKEIRRTPSQVNCSPSEPSPSSTSHLASFQAVSSRKPPRRYPKWSSSRGNTTNSLDERDFQRVANFPKSQSASSVLHQIMSNLEPTRGPGPQRQFDLESEQIPLIDYPEVSSPSEDTKATCLASSMGPLLERTNAYNKLLSESVVVVNALAAGLSPESMHLKSLQVPEPRVTSGGSRFKLGVSLDEGGHDQSEAVMQRTLSQGERPSPSSEAMRPVLTNERTHLDPSANCSSPMMPPRRRPLLRQQGTLQFEDDVSESLLEHVPLVQDVSSPSQDDGFFSQTGEGKTDSPLEDVEEAQNLLPSLLVPRPRNLNNLPLKRALTLPTSDMIQLRSPVRKYPGICTTPDGDTIINIPNVTPIRAPILRATSVDTSLVIPTLTVTINPLEDDEITYVPESPTNAPQPLKTLSESIDSAHHNGGRRNLTAQEEEDDRRCSIGSASSLHFDHHLGVPDLTIRRVSEISHINELRREMSGMEHINSEIYEVVRDVNPDTISLDTIHKTVFKRCQNKYIPPLRSSTQNKCFVIVTSGFTILGIIYGFWYKNFGPGTHSHH